MRVFDFGWQMAEKGWGKGGEGVIRLQMHATARTSWKSVLESHNRKAAFGFRLR